MRGDPTSVYFVATADRSMVKIGWSRIPKRRLTFLAGWSPVVLELIVAVDGGNMDEKALHHRFKHLHSHGEWFRGAPELLAAAEEIRAAGKLPDAFKAPEGARYPALRHVLIKRVRTPEQRERMKKNAQERWTGIRASKALWAEVDKFLLESAMPLSDFMKAMGWLPPFLKSHRDADHPYFEHFYGEKVRAFIAAHKAARAEKPKSEMA